MLWFCSDDRESSTALVIALLPVALSPYMTIFLLLLSESSIVRALMMCCRQGNAALIVESNSSFGRENMMREHDCYWPCGCCPDWVLSNDFITLAGGIVLSGHNFT